MRDFSLASSTSRSPQSLSLPVVCGSYATVWLQVLRAEKIKIKAKIRATELHYWQGPDKHLHYFFTACKKITSFKPKNKIILDSFGLNFSNLLINN